MRYQKIHAQIWHDEKFISLTDDAKYLFLYILTSPHNNSLGVYVLPPQYAAADLGWTEKRLREPFQELLAKGLILYDERVKLVCIKNHLKHNVIENENQAKAAAKIFTSLPKSPLYSHIMEPLAKPFHKPLRELFMERYAEPETKTEIKTEAKEKDILSGKPASEVVAYLNHVLGTDYKTTIRKTREIVHARLKEGFTVEDFKTVINRKARKWRGDPKMAEYLRPITLFGTKFESYLNEQEVKDGTHKRDNQNARTPAGGTKAPDGKYAGVAKTFDGLASADPRRFVRAGKQGDANTTEVLGQGVNPERPCK